MTVLMKPTKNSRKPDRKDGSVSEGTGGTTSESSNYRRCKRFSNLFTKNFHNLDYMCYW